MRLVITEGVFLPEDLVHVPESQVVGATRPEGEMGRPADQVDGVVKPVFFRWTREETKRRMRKCAIVGRWERGGYGKETKKEIAEEKRKRRDRLGREGKKINGRRNETKNARRVRTVVGVIVAVDRDVHAVLFEERLVGLAHALDLAPVLCVGRVPTRNTFFRC